MAFTSTCYLTVSESGKQEWLNWLVTQGLPKVQSVCGQGLQSAKGLTTTGGTAPKMTHLSVGKRPQFLDTWSSYGSGFPPDLSLESTKKSKAGRVSAVTFALFY